MKLYEKLHAIMSEVQYIRKDKTNQHHKYNYASEQAIKEALHPQLVKQKVLFTMDIIDTVNDGPMTTIKIAYKFIDVETGEIVEGLFAGRGIDNQDKALYKAITGAIKYILTTTFLIPTGDDPEDGEESGNFSRHSIAPEATASVSRPVGRPDSPPEPPKPHSGGGGWQDKVITEPQQRRLRKIASSSGWSEEELKRMLKRETGSDHVSEITRRDYDRVCGIAESGSAS